jgi:signal peptidase
MKILGKILYGVFITTMVMVAGLLLVSLIPNVTQKLPVVGGIEMKIVKSGSMEPTMPVGSLIMIRSANTYRVGDIITFGEDTPTKIPTSHRIISMREEGEKTLYTTKGDANEEADPRELPRGEVLGKVYVIVPYAGYVLDFARQPLGFALLIALPATMIIVDEAFTIVQEILAMRWRRGGKKYVEWMPVPQKPRAFRERIPTI